MICSGITQTWLDLDSICSAYMTIFVLYTIIYVLVMTVFVLHRTVNVCNLKHFSQTKILCLSSWPTIWGHTKNCSNCSNGFGSVRANKIRIQPSTNISGNTIQLKFSPSKQYLSPAQAWTPRKARFSWKPLFKQEKEVCITPY